MSAQNWNPENGKRFYRSLKEIFREKTNLVINLHIKSVPGIDICRSGNRLSRRQSTRKTGKAESIEWCTETKLSRDRMIWLLAHPLPQSPVRSSTPHTERLRNWDNLLTGEGGERECYKLNKELDLQSLFGLHVYSCTHWLSPRNSPPPHPPHFGLIYEGAIGQPR